MRVPDGLRIEDESASTARAEEWRTQSGPPRPTLRWALVLLGVLATIVGILTPIMSGGPEGFEFLPNPLTIIGIVMFTLGLYWLTRRS